MNTGIESWKNLLTYAYNAFSIPLLLKTLFSPWKMDTAKDAHFSILERVVYAVFSRVLGLVARLGLIGLGLIFMFLVLLTFPLFFFLPIKISKEYLSSLGSLGSELSYGDTYHLNHVGHDVGSHIDLRLYGKEKAMRMIERALSKDNNHNVLLVGDIGVGKDTLIDYLGRLGQSGLSFKGIHHHRVVELPLENITEEDFDKSLVEAKEAGNVILVIKNIHAYESLYEKLLPYLSTSHLAIVATTDFSFYDRVLKNHPEFLSKFEKVDILATNFEETVEILVNYVALHKAKIKKEVLGELVNLADRFIANQSEPLKSILIVDELRSLDKEITIEDVRQIISDKTNIPIGALGKDERKVLIELEETMRRKIVGQDEAVKDVSEALRRLRTGVADPSKPAGSFLFLGPTGVGKTYTAKILAESYFGRKDSMIRFDMSEFSQPDAVNLFSDRLASVIEENPLSLVFFDELEKAHRTIHQLLLQVLDEGRLTRASGRIANFRDSIIIATSNAGSREIIENPELNKKNLIDGLIKNNTFAPEFLNRFSGIILFRPLTSKEARDISSLLLSELSERILKDKGVKIEVTDALIDHIASAGFDPDFGARPIKRAIEEIVENKVADYIIRGETGGTIKIM
ncbi:MAG: AAA family ATPase [Patescibacteria group bacterium]